MKNFSEIPSGLGEVTLLMEKTTCLSSSLVGSFVIIELSPSSIDLVNFLRIKKSLQSGILGEYFSKNKMASAAISIELFGVN